MWSPSNQPLCPVKINGVAGFDYGVSLTLVDDSASPLWAAGRYRPQLKEFDCIGLVVRAFTPTKVEFRFGAAYSQFSQYTPLAAGSTIEVVVNGAIIHAIVRYGGLILSYTSDRRGAPRVPSGEGGRRGHNRQRREGEPDQGEAAGANRVSIAVHELALDPQDPDVRGRAIARGTVVRLEARVGDGIESPFPPRSTGERSSSSPEAVDHLPTTPGGPDRTQGGQITEGAGGRRPWR
jgi:hypothetical protein